MLKRIKINKKKEIIFAQTDKQSGSFNLKNKKNFNKNKKAYLEKQKLNNLDFIIAKLVNSNLCKNADSTKNKIAYGYDALFTTKSNKIIALTTADCIPVFIYDPNASFIALVHAGWRGIVENIIPNTINQAKQAEIKTDNLKFILGAGINSCHFEIKKDTLDYFKNYPFSIIKKENKTYIDLKSIIKDQILNLGYNKKNIKNINRCTFCDQNLFSARREKLRINNVMLSLICIKENK